MLSQGQNHEGRFTALSTRLDYVERGIEKNEVILDKRLHTMNEFRNTLKDQNGTFITRVEHEAKLLLLETKIDLLQKLVYIGVGAALVIQILLKVFIK